jgi:mono/diheme cytochrome c family protein
MIDRWPFRHGTAPGIGVLVLLAIVVAAGMQAAADRALPRGFAAAGEHSFYEHCGDCHGSYAGGGDVGPSLIAPTEPFDAGTFEHSIRKGGDTMPAVRELDDQEVADIIAFLRDLRTESGF